MSPSPKTNENSRAVVSDAGAFQVGSLTGRYSNTTSYQEMEAAIIAPRVKTVREPVVLTVIDAIDPRVLSKTYSLDKDGALNKRSGGQLEEGRARKVELGGAAAFAELLSSLKPGQALMHGLFRHDEAIVLSKKRVEKTKRQKRDAPVVTRTKDCVSWPAGPGIMVIDYDPPDGKPPLPMAALRETLYEAAPELANAPHVCRPSASSCLHATDGGRELRGVRGQRVYVLVRDAQDIERAAKVLQARLWLHGRGYFAVSSSGSLAARNAAKA